MDGSSPIEVDRPALDALRLRLAPLIRRTPQIVVNGLDLGAGRGPLVIKLEHLQRAATFKLRGVLGLVLSDDPLAARRQPRRITVASQGNYGVAVAAAAVALGHAARIYVPPTVPRPKVARMRGYGAEIVETGRREGDTVVAMAQWAAESGARVIRSDEPGALMGCGTIAAEIEEDAAIDTLLVPVGSGALLAGLALAARPGLRLIGVEPTRAPTLSRALAAGCPVTVPTSGIAQDTLGATRVSARVLAIVQRRPAETVLVSDHHIRRAQHTLWAELRLPVEPAAAVGLAALQSGAYRPAADERVGLVLTGGNTAACDLT